MNNTLSRLSVEALRIGSADAQRFPQPWFETWLGFASTNWQLLLMKPPCLRCFFIDQQIFRSRRYAWAGTSHSDSCWPVHMDLLLLLYLTLAVNEILCGSRISYTTVCGCVSPHTEVYCTFSPAVWGLCSTQSSSLSAHSLWPITDYSCRFLFLWLRPFFPCTVERLSQGRTRGGPAQCLEGNWVFSYHSRHSTHIPLPLQGLVTSVHASL